MNGATTEQDTDLALRLAEFLDSHRFGKYRGVVDEVGAGDRLGLLRAHVPEVFGADRTSPWARPSVPFAGPSHGLVAIPEVGDGVWVEFEAGDLSKPIWSGFWWADGEMPDPSAERVRVFATSKGHKLVFDDDAGEVRLEHGEGPSITLTGSEITLAVGSKKIVLSSSGMKVNDGALEVT
ncbi:MAG TPA: phage baseplate assembly protein V [Thermoanaerobaculia bacterium]|nr:phage baseplate assembly protein V [Thermoanaerobaculia bacterium]